MVKWWDTRNLSNFTKEFAVLLDDGKEDISKAEYVNCLSYEPTIPAKFMVGTNMGKVLSCRMQPKVGISGCM